MIHEIIMPKLGETMEEGYLINWRKEEGEKVEKGEILFEVMSDKTNFEVESLYSGYMRKKLYQPSDKPIPVTTVIGYISDTLDEEIPEFSPKLPKAEEIKQIETEIEKKERKEEKDFTRIRITPIAKRIAIEKGIDVTKIKGTGPDGRIEKEDVLSYIGEKTEEKTKSEGEYIVKEWTPLRRIISERLTKSKSTIPHYYIEGKIVMDSIIKLKEEKKKQNFDFSYTDFIVYFCSRTIKEYPMMNSAIIEDQIRIYNTIDIGIAVSIEEGLVVPVIKSCEKKTLTEISEEIKKLVSKAKEGKLIKEEIEGGRFVISNLGMFKVEKFYPIINPPGVAIMGIGTILKEPFVLNDTIKICSTISISLSLDHRVIDGVYAGKFFQRIKELMEMPCLEE